MILQVRGIELYCVLLCKKCNKISTAYKLRAYKYAVFEALQVHLQQDRLDSSVHLILCSRGTKALSGTNSASAAASASS